jgi:hypothetical protein
MGERLWSDEFDWLLDAFWTEWETMLLIFYSDCNKRMRDEKGDARELF